MAKIEGITINSDSLIKCYKRFYPATYSIIEKNLFHYLHLFGIRISTCDTSLPDDLIGGFRVNRLNFNESVLSAGSTDPSPKNLATLYDKEAIAKGGTAFVVEGQYEYKYIGLSKRWGGLPAFCPVSPVKSYRWSPTPESVNAWKNGKGKPLSELFETAVKNKKVKISTSTDVCIHRAGKDKKKLYGDSAGCQVLTDHDALSKLGVWANDHISKNYKNSFTYTLFTKEQFIQANKSTSFFTTSSTTSKNPTQSGGFWDAISNLLKAKK